MYAWKTFGTSGYIFMKFDIGELY